MDYLLAIAACGATSLAIKTVLKLSSTVRLIRTVFFVGADDGSRRVLRLCLAPDGSTTAHFGVQYPSHRSSLKRTQRFFS